jgi:alkanesulfonate monooxygenase SsuD/methylene tetrahydromethanopterin reductase-like flavin-dependent oxidoreductase (luciferase family)
MSECALCGTPEQCRQQLEAYEEAGVTSLAIRPGGTTLDENLAIVNAFHAL